MTREEIAKLVEGSALSEEKKRELLNAMIDKGLTREVVDMIKEALDDEVIATMKEAGADITESAEFKEAEKEFVAEVEAASQELEEGMAEIQSEIKQVQQDAAKQLEEVQAEIIKEKIAE